MSLEATTSRTKSHVAYSSLVSLIVEGGNILCMQKLRRAQSSTLEVKNEHVERFMCELFYLLLLVLSPLLVFAAALELLFLSSSWSSV